MPDRVLVVGTPVHGLRAGESAAAVAEAWQVAAPHAEVFPVASTDGGAGFLDAIAGWLRGERVSVRVGEATLTYLRAGDTAYVEAAEAIALSGAHDTRPVGDLLAALAATGVANIVVGVGGCATLDGGEGMLRALAGPVKGRREAIRAARDRLTGVTITGIVDEDRTLLGFQGAAAGAQATLGLSPEESQQAEDRMGGWVDDVRAVIPGRRDLLTGTPMYDDRLPGSGAGGGLAYGLLALGGAVEDGPAWWARLARLEALVSGSSLVVVVQEVFDWRVLEGSVLRQVADAAGVAARPVIVVADEVHVGRREVMSMGLAGAYSVTSAGMMRRDRPEAATARVELGAFGGRLAATWTPDRSHDVP